MKHNRPGTLSVRAVNQYRRRDVLTYVCFLLVDSEAPVTETSPWTHLKNRPDDDWEKPTSATDNQCHLMAQCMESWFLADREAMRRFFGQGFKENALPRNQNIEAITKVDLYDGIKAATRACETKKAYNKEEHSFQLLATLDPEKVKAASPWAGRFLETLASMNQR